MKKCLCFPVLFCAISALAQRVRSDKIELSINRIEVCDSLMRFSFSLRNLSSVRYTAEVIQYTVHDKRIGLRTAQQETLLAPVGSDAINIVPGNSAIRFASTFQAFILPKGKEMQVRIAEAGGARSVILRIQNRKLLRAKTIKDCQLFHSIKQKL